MLLSIWIGWLSVIGANSMSYLVMDKNSGEERFYIDDKLSYDDEPAAAVVGNVVRAAGTTRHLNADRAVENVTVKVGQQAVLPCFVNNLGSFKVIWAKSGDILALGSTKINSDTRLTIQHRYVSEWHLIIDNVATDDEGEYVCKTNGDFYKTIHLQVLMPPTIDDAQSVPAGTINLKEGSNLILKCFADGKPEPTVKWYRWKKYKHLESEKEELNAVGNELIIAKINRNDANIYECIAKNSVPPATSRIFNVEIHFLPVVELEIRKAFQFLHRKFSLECKVNANPLENVYWYRNGAVLNNQPDPYDHMESHLIGTHYRIDKYDISNINDFFKTLLTLNVVNAKKEDFGEYQCCAMNAYGQICSSIEVQELKAEASPEQHFVTDKPSLLASTATAKQVTQSLGEKKLYEALVRENEDEEYETRLSTTKTALLSSTVTELDSGNALGDKRRHYMIKTKQFYHSESPQDSASHRVTSTGLCWVLIVAIRLKMLF